MASKGEGDGKKMSKLEAMKAAVKNKPKPLATVATVRKPDTPKPLATVASAGDQASGKKKPKKPKKLNPRGSDARDIRAKERGRLPRSTRITSWWDGSGWSCVMACLDKDAKLVYETQRRTEGLFRTLEDLDVAFWCWVAAYPADAKKLDWHPEPPLPGKFPVGEVATVASEEGV